MEERQENGSGMTSGDESNRDIPDAPGISQCLFCGSPDVSRDAETGNVSCRRCGRDFEPPREAVGDESAPKPVRAPWEPPRDIVKPRQYSSGSVRETKPQRVEEDSDLLLPMNLPYVFCRILKIAIILGGIFAVVLGGHGLYVRYTAIDGLISGGADFADLYLKQGVPGQLKDIVVWSSLKGLESWTIPASLIAAGPFLWILQTYIPASRYRW